MLNWLKKIFDPSIQVAMDDRGDIQREREETVYLPLFGMLQSGLIATPSLELLQSMLGKVDPRWAHIGVIIYPPQKSRTSWIYVTSGLTNPWGQESHPIEKGSLAGLGFELLINLQIEAEWPILILIRMMIYQLGVFLEIRDGQLIEFDERIPLSPLGVSGYPTWMTGLVSCAAEDLPQSFQLSSGKGHFIQLTGVTTEEYAWSIDHGVPALIHALRSTGNIEIPLQRPTLLVSRGTRLPENLKPYF